MIRVSRRAAICGLRRGVGGSLPQMALLDDSLASFERPRGAAFQLSLTLLAALSDSGPYPALGGWHPPCSRCTLKQRYCASVAPGAAGLSPRRAGLSRAARPLASHALNLGPGSAPFARRYSGHRVCFLLLGLLICLSSARRPRMQRADTFVPKTDAVCLSRAVPLCIPRGSPPTFEK